MKLLVIVENKFKDVELAIPITIFKTSKQFDVIDYYHPTLKTVTGSDSLVTINNIKNHINPNKYDFVFIPGGAGVQDLRKNKVSINIISEFKRLNKSIIAVCDAPNALKENNIIDNEKFSSYPSSWSTEFRKDNYTKEINSISDNLKFISGNSPYSSTKLAFDALEIFFGKEVALNTFKAYSGQPYINKIEYK
ncbi:DJ-1/PfpI family protein [Mycoplasma leonicaptivi]|uniref:DJ-1/PfpI family protein n=1 Tax=Mycoplasma leonicaptivi TaxID=36742 RepID=UPI0004846FB4|nr:DJ-1/PfpI family protein [Mycoplasma leonicaptivi]